MAAPAVKAKKGFIRGAAHRQRRLVAAAPGIVRAEHRRNIRVRERKAADAVEAVQYLRPLGA